MIPAPVLIDRNAAGEIVFARRLMPVLVPALPGEWNRRVRAWCKPAWDVRR